jgi:hypothetical protein
MQAMKGFTMTQQTQQGKPAPDMIKLAIMAAGGPNEVAAELGLTHWGVRQWPKVGRVPVEYVRRLCDMGGVITYEQLLAYIEANSGEKVAA